MASVCHAGSGVGLLNVLSEARLLRVLGSDGMDGCGMDVISTSVKCVVLDIENMIWKLYDIFLSLFRSSCGCFFCILEKMVLFYCYVWILCVCMF